MKRVLPLLAVACGLTLSACDDDFASKLQSVTSFPVDVCDLSDDPRFAVLRGKYPLRLDHLLASPSSTYLHRIPNEIERRALAALDVERSRCRALLTRAAVSVTDHQALATLSLVIFEADRDLSTWRRTLAAGHITYGAYHYRQNEIVQNTIAAMSQFTIDRRGLESSFSMPTMTIAAPPTFTPRQPAARYMRLQEGEERSDGPNAMPAAPFDFVERLDFGFGPRP